MFLSHLRQQSFRPKHELFLDIASLLHNNEQTNRPLKVAAQEWQLNSAPRTQEFENRLSSVRVCAYSLSAKCYVASLKTFRASAPLRTLLTIRDQPPQEAKP